MEESGKPKRVGIKQIKSLTKKENIGILFFPHLYNHGSAYTILSL